MTNILLYSPVSRFLFLQMHMMYTMILKNIIFMIMII